MLTWTDSAQALLESHNQAMRQDHVVSGADPDEVAADLRRHIEEELTAAKIHIATREDVQRVLARMGTIVADSPAGQQRPKSKVVRRAIGTACLLVIAVGIFVVVQTREKRADLFAVTVPFELGTSHFLTGDSITIQRVTGSSAVIAPGQTVRVEGTYTLGSRNEAVIALNTTSIGPSASVHDNSKHDASVKGGSGQFQVDETLSADGYLHVSFYPVTFGSSFGGVYFGQGDRVLRNPIGVTDGTSKTLLVDVEFPYPLEFVPRIPDWGRFRPGDEIVITSVRGDRKHFEPGGTYLVRGTYTLASEASADLSLSVTVTAPTQETHVSHPGGGISVARGTGEFSLRYTMVDPGSFHISYNVPGMEGSIGTVYFSEVAKVDVASPGINRNNAKVVIGIGASGDISVNGKVIGDSELASILSGMQQADHDLTVLISAESTTPLNKLQNVMNACRKAGVTRFSIQSR